MGDSDNNNNEAPSRSSSSGVHRCHLSRGMERIARTEPLALDPSRDAPPLVIAFELTDPTAMPRMAQEMVWLMQHSDSAMQKDEAGAYIYGLDGFSVDRQVGSKDIMFRMDVDGRTKTLLPELQMQARVCEVHADADGAPKELYLLLVVRSPLAFSARHGALITIKPTGRRMQSDNRGVDERRRVWARLALHVRQMVLPRMNNAELLRTFETSMDWMRVSEPDGFTCLFSAQMAFEWIRSHYAAKHHITSGRLIVPGLKDPIELGDDEGDGLNSVVTPDFVVECRLYDQDVDRETKRTMAVRLGLNKKKKKKPSAAADKRKMKRGGGVPAQRKRNRAGAPMMVPEEDDDDANEERGGDGGAAAADAGNDDDEDEEDDHNGNARRDGEEEERYVACVRPPRSMALEEEGWWGVPACKVHIELLLSTPLEGQRSLAEFRRQLSTFPESVMLELLQGSLNLSSELMRQVASRVAGGDEEATVGITEMRDIVIDGGRLTAQVQMLAMHDSEWGAQTMRMVRELEGAVPRMNLLRDLARMGFALAFTRATGSGGATNGRVAAYGRFITHKHGETSRAECRQCYVASHRCEASMTHQAWQYAMEQMHACNQRAWHLRPDNLFLFFQLMVSDLQLTLNFYGSVVDGAHNGIGATLVICDGNRNYRRSFYDRETNGRSDGVVFDKSNSTGADTALNDFKMAATIGGYAPQFAVQGDVYTELKRVTELSLVQATCDIWEGLPGNMTLKHAVTETMGRKYSTELKANGDQQSENCMTAIAWLIPRNTKTTACNSFQTTRENDQKERVLVEYRQVTDGYLVMCANKVRGTARERFHTMMAVSRSIASAADGMNLDLVMDTYDDAEREAERVAQDGRVDPMVNGGSARLDGLGRGLFFAGMGTAMFAGFMQWTGMLGQICEPRTTEALLRTFMAHFELCNDLLNPDMASAGNRARFLEVSKARGVAVSLLGIGMRETIESGRRNESQQMAVERTCAAFRVEGASAAVAWIMADTLEHMLRMDFFMLMQMLFQMLAAPYVCPNALLEWMETGEADRCPEAAAFVDRCELVLPSAVDERMGINNGTQLTPIDQCLYISNPHLRVSRLDTPMTPEVRSQFCDRVAKKLWSDFSPQLSAHANLNDKNKGDQVVRAMIEHCIDRQFMWPSVLGRPSHFGLGRVEASLFEVAPIRMVMEDLTEAKLCVDLRWLLLVGALSEGCLSQSSRFSIVGRLVQRFYHHCVPAEMMCAEDLFIGLPTQWTGAGFVWPEVLPTRRRMLRRPGTDVGTDAPCRSGLVEDMGAAAPRLELAKLLGVSERDLPTECVHYEFPPRIATPVLLEDAQNAPASLMWRDGRFWLLDGCVETDITAEEEDADGSSTTVLFLSGRVTRPVRPMLHFYRPGILVVVSVAAVVVGGVDDQQQAWGRVAGFCAAKGRFEVVFYPPPLPPIMLSSLEREFWTAYEVDERLVLPNSRVRFDALALPEGVRLQREVGNGAFSNLRDAIEATGELESLQVEDVPDGHVVVRMRRAKRQQRAPVLFGASHGAKACIDSETRLAHRFHVPVGAIRGVEPPDTALAPDAWTRVVAVAV